MKLSILTVTIIATLFQSNGNWFTPTNQKRKATETFINHKMNPTATADNSYKLNSVTSKDGTTIGYRQYGQGPGLILVQGAMGIAYNYHELALALSKDFTVYVPDRRGRTMSAKPFTSNHAIERDIEDLQALMDKTGSTFLFGLSSGAIITLEACRVLPNIQKAVVYEPPFYVDGVPAHKIHQVYKEVEEDKLGAALATVFKIVKVGPPAFNYVPLPILKQMTSAYIQSEVKKGTGEYASMKELIPTMRFDFKVVLDRGDNVNLYKSVQNEVMLMGGSKSPRYLVKALDSLETILPKTKRIQFKGLDHSGPWNQEKGGNPEVIAQAMIQFFRQ